MKKQHTLLSGAILGFLSVALGAFGAHALKPLLSELGRIETFELAVRYQFFHALALLIIGLLQQHTSELKLNYSAALLSIGVFIFSGSLYLLSFMNNSALGMITPIGGFCLLAGWATLIFSFIPPKNLKSQ